LFRLWNEEWRESGSIAGSRSASGSELVALNVQNLEETEDGF
jgi:hypothetical protein